VTGAPRGSLCVVIPHYSRADLLVEAVAAVRGWPVVVVDDSPAGLSERPGGAPGLGGAQVVRAGGGSGFARAANRGLAVAEEGGFRWVLLLNDDAAPEAGCLEALLDAVSGEPGEAGEAGQPVRAAGPVLLGPIGVESAGIRYSERTGRLRQRTAAPDGVMDVDALSGACLLMPASARFDEGYTHGFEDVALALALRRAGGRVVIVPAARCRHIGGATLDRRSRAAARAAVQGHLRLVGRSRIRRAAVVGYALAQVARERGPAGRLLGIWEGWRMGRRVRE